MRGDRLLEFVRDGELCLVFGLLFSLNESRFRLGLPLTLRRFFFVGLLLILMAPSLLRLGVGGSPATGEGPSASGASDEAFSLQNISSGEREATLDVARGSELIALAIVLPEVEQLLTEVELARGFESDLLLLGVLSVSATWLSRVG